MEFSPKKITHDKKENFLQTNLGQKENTHKEQYCQISKILNLKIVSHFSNKKAKGTFQFSL